MSLSLILCTKLESIVFTAGRRSPKFSNCRDWSRSPSEYKDSTSPVVIKFCILCQICTSPPPQFNICILCFSFFCCKSLDFITWQYLWISVTPYFQTSSNSLCFQSAYPFQLPTLPRISLSTRPDSSKTLAALVLYKLCTYLLTYFHTLAIISQLPNLFIVTPRICNCILLLIVWVRSFSKRLPSVTFAEEKVLIFLILREKC